MGNQKGNEYGVVPKYETGDKVRIWPIYKNPIGVVVSCVDDNAFPMKFVVRYTYWEGGEFTETFNSDDLTLVERKVDWFCNCQYPDRHADWCNKRNWGK